jgi:phosphoribosylformylglycinamidine synthase
MVGEQEIPLTLLGSTGGDAFVVRDLFEVPLVELHAAWSATLPALFG